MQDIDHDMESMDRDQLVAEVKKLRAGIRQHRDADGHSLCWWVPEIWSLLPERRDPRPRVPPFGEFLENCARYRESLDNSTVVTPMAFVRGKGLCFIEPEETPVLPVDVSVDPDAGLKHAYPVS